MRSRGGVRCRLVVRVTAAMALALALLVLALLGALPGAQVLRTITFYSSWMIEQRLYKLDVSWPKLPGYFTGQTFCVGVDPISDLVYVAQRGVNVPKVLVFSENGDFRQAWNSTVEMPHGIFVASNGTDSSVWITDVGNGKYGHTVKQYSTSGKPVQTLGTPGKPGSALIPLQFDQPAEIFVDQNGDIYIVDGDGGLNNRLLKLTNGPEEMRFELLSFVVVTDLYWFVLGNCGLLNTVHEGEVMWLHAENGTGAAQFRIPHSVTVDSVGRVWVADRANRRIQVFDKVTGEWLGAWSSCFKEDGPYSVRLTPNEKYLIVAQLNINRVSILAAPPVGSIGDCIVVNIIQMADEVKPHLVDVNVKTGAIYVAAIGSQQVHKYVPLN